MIVNIITLSYFDSKFIIFIGFKGRRKRIARLSFYNSYLMGDEKSCCPLIVKPD